MDKKRRREAEPQPTTGASMIHRHDVAMTQEKVNADKRQFRELGNRLEIG